MTIVAAAGSSAQEPPQTKEKETLPLQTAVTVTVEVNGYKFLGKTSQVSEQRREFSENGKSTL